MYSLITTVFNEERSIKNFIKSLNEQTVFPNEIIIVDGGSSDNTVNLIKENISSNLNYNLIVDSTCNKSHTIGPIAKGRNTAIKNTSYDYILVTDAGCILDRDWVKEMITSFEKDSADVVSGWYKAVINNEFQKEMAEVFCPPVEKINKKNFLPSSRSIGFKKDLWEMVNGYPENSYTAEDTVFDLKIFKFANNIVFNEKAYVYWDVPADKNELKEKLVAYGYGEGRQKLYLFKYILRTLLLILFPILLVSIMLGIKKKNVFTFYYYQIKGYFKGYFL